MEHILKLHGKDVRVNDAVTLSHIRDKTTDFFSGGFGRRQTFTLYRGFVVVRATVCFGSDPPVRRTQVYAFLNYSPTGNHWQTRLIAEPMSTIWAKRIIDRMYASGTIA